MSKPQENWTICYDLKDYTPKGLSGLDIYRQCLNQLAKDILDQAIRIPTDWTRQITGWKFDIKITPQYMEANDD